MTCLLVSLFQDDVPVRTEAVTKGPVAPSGRQRCFSDTKLEAASAAAERPAAQAAAANALAQAAAEESHVHPQHPQRGRREQRGCCQQHRRG